MGNSYLITLTHIQKKKHDVAIKSTKQAFKQQGDESSRLSLRCSRYL